MRHPAEMQVIRECVGEGTPLAKPLLAFISSSRPGGFFQESSFLVSQIRILNYPIIKEFASSGLSQIIAGLASG